MNFKKVKEIKRNDFYGIWYDTYQSFDIDTIIKVIKLYEDEKTKMFECRCDVYSEDGNIYHPHYRSVEALDDLYSLGTPSINVEALYINPKSNSYRFTIAMAANTRGMNYYVDELDNNYVKKQIEKAQ